MDRRVGDNEDKSAIRGENKEVDLENTRHFCPLPKDVNIHTAVVGIP